MKQSLQKSKKEIFPRYLFIQSWYDFILVTDTGEKINRIIRHPLILGSTTIFFGGFLGNVFNLLFNVFMSRNISDADYGVLASLSNIITLFTLPVGALLPMLLYFSASYFANGQLDMVRGIYKKVTLPSLIVGIILLIIFFVFRSPIAHFFKIQESAFIILVGLNVLMSFVALANQPLLQAKLEFGFLAFLNTFSAFLKLSLGIFFVFLGYSVGGVLWAFIISGLIPYFLSFFPLKFLLSNNVTTPSVSLKTMLLYGAPAALAVFGLTSLMTLDIVLVKHFFSLDDAGIYARLSLIGKVIYYFSAPIASVMFPLIAQKHTKGENFHNDLKLSLLLVFLPSVCILVFYWLFPTFVVSIFSPKPMESNVISLILPFGVFMSIYGLLSVLTNFFLSINKVTIFIPILISAILQAILIWIFHETFLQVIYISITIAGLLLIGLLLYYLKLYGQTK